MGLRKLFVLFLAAMAGANVPRGRPARNRLSVRQLPQRKNVKALDTNTVSYII
jgi:hypothetical protein